MIDKPAIARGDSLRAELLPGPAIRAARQQAGLTLENLSERCGVSANQIGNIERGSIGRYPPEYRQAAITLGWFRRKLNKLETENAEPH